MTLNGTILQVRNTADNAQLALSAAGAGKVPDIKMENSDATATRRIFETVYEGVNNLAKWRFANETNGSITQDNVLVLGNTGNVGIGVAPPAARLHTTGSVRFAGVNSCGAGIVSAADGTLSVPRLVGTVQARRRRAGAAEGGEQRDGAAPADRHRTAPRRTSRSTG